MSNRLRGRGDWTKWNTTHDTRYGLREAALTAIWRGERPPGPELASADVADMLGASLRASLRIIDPGEPM